MTADALTIAGLEQWVLAGAHWQLIELTERLAVVDLCACTGEPVERRRSGDPEVIEYLRSARSDFDRG